MPPRQRRSRGVQSDLDYMRLQFLKTILAVTVALAAVLAWPLISWVGPSVREAVLVAAAVAFANVMVGLILIEYGFDKSNSTFMIAVLGGMGIRMALMLVVLTLLLLAGFHQLALVLSFMAFYVIYLIAELYYVVRILGRRGTSTKRSVARSRRRSAGDSYYFQPVRN